MNNKKLKDLSGLSGLINMGNTCWFNSIIQNLAYTKPIHDYLFDLSYKEDINIDKSEVLVLESFFNLLNKLFKNSININELRSFKSIINEHNEMYENLSQFDSHEFLLFLINKLHEALSYEATIEIHGTIINPVDKKQVKSINSWTKFFGNEYSYLIDLIYGQYNSYLKCLKCNSIFNTYEPFLDLELSIDNSTNNIYDCLNKLTNVEILENNEWKCSKCNKTSSPKKQIQIWKIPNILIISFKRFDNYGNKINLNIDFPINNLDLSDYINGYDKDDAIYDLYSINNHSGRSINSGHYFTYSKHLLNNNWFEFNDNNVSSINENKIITKNAYILFYQKQ
jgi:ubiquitin C-terminal hydrolase